MKPPIFLDNKGDIIVFDSVERAVAWIEPIDVINNEYFAFDAAGNRLSLSTDRDAIKISVDTQNPVSEAELIERLLDFLRRAGKARDLPQHCNFASLVERFQASAR